MIDGSTIVIDIGKTNAKVSLWDGDGCLLDRRIRANDIPAEPPQGLPFRRLDVHGIDRWLMESLADYARSEPVRHIVPIGHGAAAALVHGNELLFEPMDYEQSVPDPVREAYSPQRDPFSATGSPELPLGLNLGLQLHFLEHLAGPLGEDVNILPWPQYWAWRLTGVMASELSSLGCHTDLWRPFDRRYSDLAVKRGWAKRMAPLRTAAEVLGPVLPGIADKTGLPEDCVVHCGLHDSNAALVATLGHACFAGQDTTVLSTGTWFIAMRSLAAGVELDRNDLAEARDCLVNVDVRGRPVPSARFMGGRELEAASEQGTFDYLAEYDPQRLLERLPGAVESNACILPSLAPGVGPFPATSGHWCNRPEDEQAQRAAASLYLALVADTSLELIGSQNSLLIEGRFAGDTVFVRSLATLRPDQAIFVNDAQQDVALGALRLIDPGLSSEGRLTQVESLEIDLDTYRAAWGSACRDLVRARGRENTGGAGAPKQH